MELKNILELSTLFAGLFVLGRGVISDIRNRQFSNDDFLQAIGIGCIYQYVSMESLELEQFSWIFLFLIFNLVGILAHHFVKISAGDLKFLSVMILFLDLNDPRTLPLLIVSILIIGGMWMIFWPIIHYHDFNQVMQHYKAELWNLRSFIYTKQTITDISDLQGEELKKRTHPFTVQLYLALLSTMVISLLCF